MLHKNEFKQFIKSDIDTLWEFISSPKNLQKITPKEMAFVIKDHTNLDIKMYPGQIIEYKVSPLLGIKLNWVTEITHVEHKKYFVDEQRFGPYSFWHHKHFLNPVDGGVEMIDIIHYKIPFGLLGRLMNSLFIRNKLISIFEYRKKVLDEMFNKN